MKIAYIGNFERLWDEEYIAQAFERLGHTVLRIPERSPAPERLIAEFGPDIVLWAKLNIYNPQRLLDFVKANKIKSVCWVWDLYFDYPREPLVKTAPMFKADRVFTSDGGHQERWEELGIDHTCIRQGMHEGECYLEEGKPEYDVVFIGSDNRYNQERNEIFDKLEKDFSFTWIGKDPSQEVRGPKLNRILAKSKVIVGDSVYSAHYWSNRVVETLGRGGFLIHQEVEGIKEQYPYLVTYKRGDYEDLRGKIRHYLTHGKERKEIIKKNHEWVKNNHLCKHRCQELLDNLKQNG